MMMKLLIPFQSIRKETYLMLSVAWIVLFVIGWLCAPVLIASPVDTSKQLLEFLSDPDFYSDVFATLGVTILGMITSIVISCCIAYLSQIPIGRPLGNIISVLRFLSMAGFIFTFTLLFHGAYHVKLALLILSIVPFFVLTLVTTFSEIEQQEYDFWTTLGFSRWKQLWYITIRGKAEIVMKTIKSNFAIAWIMIGAIETYSMADGGIGVLLFKANGKTQIDKVFALQLIVLAFGAAFDLLLKYLRLWTFPHVALAESN